MILLEAGLLVLTLVLTVAASVSDCTKGIIPNKLLLAVALPAAVLDGIYYGFFVRDCLAHFAVNLLFLTLVGVFFYCCHLWAAGDSKLLFTVALCIPGRFYTFWDIGLCSSFAIVIFVFSIAFLYTIGESVVLGIREKNLFRIHPGRISIPGWILNYLTMAASITACNAVLWSIFEDVLAENRLLSAAVCFFLVLAMLHIREKLSDKGTAVWCVIAVCVVLLLAVTGLYVPSSEVDLRAWIGALAIMIIRLAAEKYNYQTVPTGAVKAGQILSAATVMSFTASRVQGLPQGMTEDLRSRLTAEEAESVHRWENSAGGRPWVVIVRKIPFAIFIGVGTALFLGIELMMVCFLL